MKRSGTILAALVLAASFASSPACVVTDAPETVPPTTPDADIVVSPFYDALAPYGDWVWVDAYGWVWIPSATIVGFDFVPYATGGWWVYTHWGWSFATRWSWGWAPFHYGNWVYDPIYGWIWVPDTVWGPAWVDWRYGGGYIGWAPIPPHHHHHADRGRVVVREHSSHWIYTAVDHFGRRDDVIDWVLGSDEAHRAERATAPGREVVEHGGATWYAGPPREILGRSVEVEPVTPPERGRVVRVPVGPDERALPAEPAPIERPKAVRPAPSRAPRRVVTPEAKPKLHPSLVPGKVTPPRPATPARPAKPVRKR
jgi:hypothetical protein